MKETMMRKIAEINGLQPSSIDLAEVSWLTKTKNPVPPQDYPEYTRLISKYVVSQDTDLVDSQGRFERLLFERFIRLKQYRQAVDGVQDESFYGQNAISYLYGLALMRKEGALPVGSNALLIGAITRDSLTQFTHTNKILDPKVQTFCVDVKGEETRLPNTFVLGDGFRLPFKDASFDTVQTHRLIDYMHAQNEGHVNDVELKKFFKEVYRVLKPGGGFMRIDGHVHNDVLKDSGFEMQFLGHSVVFKDDLSTYSFFDEENVVLNESLDDLTVDGKDVFILARKPPEKIWVNDGKTTW